MRNPLDKIAEVAERYIGIKEVTRNQAPAIAEFWKDTDYTDGMANREPYCAAFCCFCVQQAGRELDDLRLKNPPRFAAVKDWVVWANKSKEAILFGNALRDGYLPMRGDVVIFLPKLSHAGIVTSYDPARGIVRTVEANTSRGTPGSQRDGDGIFPRERAIDFCGSFIRLAVRPQKV